MAQRIALLEGRKKRKCLAEHGVHVDVETCILKKAEMLFVLVTVDEKSVAAKTSWKQGSQSISGTKGRETGDEMKYRHGNTAE